MPGWLRAVTLAGIWWTCAWGAFEIHEAAAGQTLGAILAGVNLATLIVLIDNLRRL